jgi:hypothetical protein
MHAAEGKGIDRNQERKKREAVRRFRGTLLVNFYAWVVVFD